MRITVEPLESKFIIKEMSLKDIDNMIETLSSMKKDIHLNVENLKDVDINHIPTKAELQGAVGYHPEEEFHAVSADIVYKDTWQEKTLRIESISCRKELSCEKHGDLSLLVEFDEEDDKQKSLALEDAPNKIEIEHRWILKESTFETVTNLEKAEHLIKQMYLGDGNELISAQVKWQPCGGTYVVEVIDSYFLVEVNIDGLAIKEISRDFYDSFAKEFS